MPSMVCSSGSGLAVPSALAFHPSGCTTVVSLGKNEKGQQQLFCSHRI